MKHTLRPFLVLMAGSALVAVSPAAYAGAFEDALKSAYESNPRIAAQRRSLEQADERVSQAISIIRPSVTTSYSKGRQRNRFDTDTWSYSDSENKELQINQPLFQGGAEYFRYSSAKNLMMASRADLNNLTQDVLLDAVTAYMDVIQNQSVLELSKKNETVLSKQLDASRNRFEVGDVTRTDVAQSEARYSRAQTDTIQAKGDLDSSLAKFERVMGFKPENLPLAMPENLPEIPATLDEAIERGIKNSPVLIASSFQQHSSEDDIGTNAAALLPQVSLNGTLRRQDGAGVAGRNTFDNDSITVNVNLPLYQRGTEYSRIREARILSKRAEFREQDTEDAVREATIQAWERLQTSVSTIKAQEEAIKAAETALSGVRKEQEYGARTILDVLNAEQELFSARVSLVRAQRTRLVAIYNLLNVIGDMTLTRLNIDAAHFDPTKHYDSVKWQLIGF